MERAYKLCLLGLTDVQVALCFDVNADTLNEWKHKYPEFDGALKRGREQADQAVAHSLFQRAIGYRHRSVKIFNNEGVPLIVPFTEYFPPDVTACIFWLKNRHRDKWTDKGQEITVSNNVANFELPEAFMDAVRKLAKERISRGKG